MAMTAREFLEQCKKHPPQVEIQRKMREAEEAEDRYWDEFSDLIEQHPPGLPRQLRAEGQHRVETAIRDGRL